MRFVRLAVIVAGMAASSAATAQSAAPRSIFDVLFNRKPAVVEAPTVLTPAPRPGRAESFTSHRTVAADKPQPAPARKAAKKPAKEKTEVIASFIDPQPRATSSYTGPFRGGGNQPVCVRLCDGFFFPVNYEGAKGNDRYEEACQASCPGTKTEVYFMPRGADLNQAATARGHRYTALETAFKYCKVRDQACSCKSADQTWGRVLQNAESLVRKGKTDIVVTDDRAVGPPAPSSFESPSGGDEPLKPLAQANLSRPFSAMGIDRPLMQPPADGKDEMLRSLFGEAGGRTNRFLKIDPIETGAIRQTLP